MASYKVFLKASALREIESLPSAKLRRQVLARIRALAEDPRPPGSEKLSGMDKYRLRQGSYRIIYVIVDDVLTVHVVSISHRREAYR